jgi:WD40 repeat protein
MIVDLLRDYADVLEVMPAENPRQRILKLLAEAIRRDISFLQRHPTTLFQCVWNSCWWYDCPEAAGHYVEPESGWNVPPPWAFVGCKLFSLLEEWRAGKEQHLPGFRWLRSIHPLQTPLGGRLRCTLRGHETWVCDIAFSPDGRQLASVSGDRTVRVWDVIDGVQLATLLGHTQDILKVAYSADGSSLISKGQTEEAVWDNTNGWQLIELKELPKVEPQGLGIWSHSGQWYAQPSIAQNLDAGEINKAIELASRWGGRIDHEAIEVHDSINGITRRCRMQQESWVNYLTFSADDRLLASGSGKNDVLGLPPDDCSVHIWDTSTWTELACLNGHLAAVHDLKFTPDNRLLISASSDHTARVWNVLTGELIASLQHPASLGCLAVSANGRWLATVAGDPGDDNAIRIWDLGDTLNPELRLNDAHLGRFEGTSADRQTIITYHGQGDVCVREAQSGLMRNRFMSNLQSFGAGALSPNGELFAIEGPDLSIEVWNTITGQLHMAFGRRAAPGVPADDAHFHGPLRFMFLEDGRKLLSVGMMERLIGTWNVESGKALARVDGHSNVPRCGYEFAISPDQQCIASFREFISESEIALGRIRIWDVDTGQVLSQLGQEMESGRSVFGSLSFSTDGLRLATFSFKGAEYSVCVFDLNSGTEWASLPLPKEFVRFERLALSSNGSRVACELYMKPLDSDTSRIQTPIVCVWNVLSGALLAKTTGVVPLEIFAEGENVLMAVSRGSETAIVSAINGETVATVLGAWINTPLQDRVWTGGPLLNLDYHYLMRLEGVEIDEAIFKRDAAPPPIDLVKHTQLSVPGKFFQPSAPEHELTIKPPTPAPNALTLAATNIQLHDEISLLRQVEQKLADGKVSEAFELFKKHSHLSVYDANARGVCLLRLGRVEEAIQQFRKLTLSGIRLIPDVPLEFKTNLATALLLSCNVQGCHSLLDEIQYEQHPSVQRLRMAIQQWKASLGLRDRLRWFWGCTISRSITLDFPVGELLIPDSVS